MIAAVITATNCSSFCRLTACVCGSSTTAAGSSVFTGSGFSPIFLIFSSNFGIYQKSEISNEIKISITNTVPIPIKVFANAVAMFAITFHLTKLLYVSYLRFFVSFRITSHMP